MVIDTIYYIDNSIKAAFSARSPNFSEQQFFGDIASAYQHGYCYLCGDIGSLNYLTSLSGPTGDIYNTAYNRYAQNGAAFRTVRTVFVLTYRDVESEPLELPESLREKDKCYPIHIPTAINASWKLYRECCLLTENLEDGKFYQFIAKYYCWKRNILEFPFRFHPETGGGSSISEELEKCLCQDKTLVLCLVDSDQKYGKTKRYPQPAAGETLTRVKQTLKTLPTKRELPPYALQPLYVHEIENLIPTQMLEELAQEQCPNMRPGLDRISDLQQVNGGEPILYYDYKNGFPYMKGEPMRTYWKDVILELGGDELSMPPESKPTSPYDPEDLFFPPLQSNILRHIVKRIKAAEETGAGNLKEIQVDKYLETIWENLGELLLTWGYANEPLRA